MFPFITLIYTQHFIYLRRQRVYFYIRHKCPRFSFPVTLFQGHVLCSRHGLVRVARSPHFHGRRMWGEFQEGVGISSDVIISHRRDVITSTPPPLLSLHNWAAQEGKERCLNMPSLPPFPS